MTEHLRSLPHQGGSKLNPAQMAESRFNAEATTYISLAIVAAGNLSNLVLLGVIKFIPHLLAAREVGILHAAGFACIITGGIGAVPGLITNMKTDKYLHLIENAIQTGNISPSDMKLGPLGNYLANRAKRSE